MTVTATLAAAAAAAAIAGAGAATSEDLVELVNERVGDHLDGNELRAHDLLKERVIHGTEWDQGDELGQYLQEGQSE